MKPDNQGWRGRGAARDERPSRWLLKMAAPELRLVMAVMGQTGTDVCDLCKELGITRQTLYRHAAPDGALREDGRKLFNAK